MELRLFFIVMAAILIVLIPMVPRIVGLRIKILRMLKWNCLADFHEKYFDQLVIIVRAMIAFIIVILLFLFLRA
jgi:hypothetical protein